MFNRMHLRPRFMHQVVSINTTPSLINHEISLPPFISPTAMVHLVHSDGELTMSRACVTHDMIQTIATNVFYSAEEMASQPEVEHHPIIFHGYVNKDRGASKGPIGEILKLPKSKSIIVTTDAAAPGNREADERVKADERLQSPMTSTKPKGDKNGDGYGKLLGSGVDPSMCWEDVELLKELTKAFSLS